jgi:hypothetical protein
MKTMILTASVLTMLFIANPVLAVDEHHPESQSAPAEARMKTDKVDASVRQMQEMRKKIETEKNPAARKELMHQHMRMMKDGMNMMTMMTMKGGKSGKSGKGGKGGMMTEQKDTASMPMADRMAMMEKKMTMMEKMMGQGGGMMGGGASDSPTDDHMGMMEKNMMMMQEMMNGMMMQHEMMIK